MCHLWAQGPCCFGMQGGGQGQEQQALLALQGQGRSAFLLLLLLFVLNEYCFSCKIIVQNESIIIILSFYSFFRFVAIYLCSFLLYLQQEQTCFVLSFARKDSDNGHGRTSGCPDRLCGRVDDFYGLEYCLCREKAESWFAFGAGTTILEQSLFLHHKLHCHIQYVVL